MFNYLGNALTGYYAGSVNYGTDLVDHFFGDASEAYGEGSALDSQIVSMGQAVLQNYSDILESAVRRTFGSLEVLIPHDSKDTSQASAGTKEISTDGNVQTIADLVPQMFPAFVALAPDYMRLMLRPILDYTNQWPDKFMFHDLGKHYPNATGETAADQEPLIVDQTSVIHWMALMYQRTSGNTDFVKPYIDSIGGTANQTVLAIYSALALKCFGQLSGMSNYSAIGDQFASTILDLGLSSDGSHIIANYGSNDASWITTYPFAMDKLLNMQTFNETTYALESKWYEGQLNSYSMQFFSGVQYTVGDLMLWAASTSSEYVRDSLFSGIHHFLTNGLNSEPGPSLWYVSGPNEGIYRGSIAKGISGSYFMQSAVDMFAGN